LAKPLPPSGTKTMTLAEELRAFAWSCCAGSADGLAWPSNKSTALDSDRLNKAADTIERLEAEKDRLVEGLDMIIQNSERLSLDVSAEYFQREAEWCAAVARETLKAVGVE
ncbi:MAG: hypothetical protein KGL39_56135, partial [Patescibacteria group bacterium]|nr:hypothetical protein [Patescibacteria group bacterium]